MKLYFLTLLLLFLVAVMPVTIAAQTNSMVGTMAPTPVLINTDGNYTYLSRFYGTNTNTRTKQTTVALYFTSVHCVPCHKLLPHFLEVINNAQAQKTENDAGVCYYLVYLDPLSKKDSVLAFLDAHNIDTRHVLLDPYQRAAKRFGIQGVPRTLVIAPTGEIVGDFTGKQDNYKEQLSNVLKITSGKP